MLLFLVVAEVMATHLRRGQSAEVNVGVVKRAEDDKDVRKLELGKPIERELAGDGAHSYKITLTAGQYINVIVDQRGIDVAVTVIAPDGNQMFEFNEEIRENGHETVTLVADATGSYRLNVQPVDKRAAPGHYEIRPGTLRAATDQDRALQEARKLHDESIQLRTKGQYDAALPLAERALSIRERALGPDHPDFGRSLNNLATVFFGKRDYAQAEGLYQRSLAILEKALGRDHPLVAQFLINLANLHFQKRDYVKAEPLYSRALEIREKSLGREHADVATTLTSLATLYNEQADYEKAEPMLKRALAIREKSLGPEHTRVANSLGILGVLYETKGEYDKAEPLYSRALAIREKVFGPAHPDVGTSLNSLAVLYSKKGDHTKAEVLYQRALVVFEKSLGNQHPRVALTLNNLAVLYGARGEYSKAEPLYERALAIREKALGPEHPDIAQTLNNLAVLYEARGDYTKAEPIYQRALAIREKALGPNHPDVATSLNSLGVLYSKKGDIAKAEPLYQRTLAIWTNSLGPEHPRVGLILNNLAVLYETKGDYVQAEPFYQRALAIREKAIGLEHPDVAESLDNLAAFYSKKGDYAKAIPLYERALVIREKTLGPAHPDVSVILYNFATLYVDQGDYVKAELLYQRALVISEKALGSDHPDVARTLESLSRLYRDKGEHAKAVEYLSRAIKISERDIALNLAAGSERQKLLYLATMSQQNNDAISFHVQDRSADATARSLAVTTVLQRKGRTLDAMTNISGALRLRANPQDRELMDQLIGTRSRLSKLVLGGLGKSKPAEYQAEIRKLEEEVDELESSVSRRSAEFRAQSQAVTLEAIRAAIPNDTVLVEFVSYRPFNARSTKRDEQFGEPRYVAYAVRNQSEPAWVELGDAKTIDSAIDAWRKALRDPNRRDVKQKARAVDEKVFQPVRKLLGNARRVLLSPDGALNLIPFAALVDERGQYLAKNYLFSYLTSGRDLLRLQVKTQSKQGAIVVADPDFGGDTTPCLDRKLKLSKDVVDFSRILFCPLAATAGEAEALQGLMPDATVLTKQRATEAAVKGATRPKILHIATHGFFLGDVAINLAAATRGVLSGTGQPGAAMKVENPLLRSGLALAGANLHKSGDDDGVLTALEAAGLDLWGTKLVVLSACDTGLGEVKNGDGVYGLRRALVLAGSESQVMSLWPVSDTATRDLMIGYYKGLQAGEGRGEALRQVQLRVLASKKRQHPYYWASFIQSGEWANLDGKR